MNVGSICRANVHLVFEHRYAMPILIPFAMTNETLSGHFFVRHCPVHTFKINRRVHWCMMCRVFFLRVCYGRRQWWKSRVVNGLPICSTRAKSSHHVLLWSTSHYTNQDSPPNQEMSAEKNTRGCTSIDTNVYITIESDVCYHIGNRKHRNALHLGTY